MKAFLLVVLLAVLALGATEEEKSDDVTVQSVHSDKSSDPGYKLHDQSERLEPRPARWQTRMNTRGWLGGSPEGMHPSITETDPDYYPKLFNWLDKVGRR